MNSATDAGNRNTQSGPSVRVVPLPHKAALIVPHITADVEKNLATIERLAQDAVAAGGQLLLLPEAVLTGLENNDDPAHDLPLGQPIPGPATQRLGAFCARHQVWLGLGMLEREADRLYDSAVLLGPDGGIRLNYRRNQPKWHGRAANPEVYRQGTEVRKVETPFGSVGFLVCGDLYDDDVVARFRDLHADWLLFPFAYCYDNGAIDQGRWDREELPEYQARIRLLNTPALMVNSLANPNTLGDPCFGGALVVSANGELKASLPLGTEGVLMFDLASLTR